MKNYIRIPCAGAQSGCLSSISLDWGLLANPNELQRAVRRAGYYVIEPIADSGSPVVLACTACTPRFLAPEHRQIFEERFEARRAFMS